jgi:hypothetical protein
MSCISRLNSRGRENLLQNSSKNDHSIKQKDKEGMVQESGRATDQLSAISRHLGKSYKLQKEVSLLRF